jgi:ABC-type lipoprotein release transport system permease subunit
VDISLTNYCLVFIAVLAVAIFTVFRQLRQTINAEPAEALRYE